MIKICCEEMRENTIAFHVEACDRIDICTCVDHWFKLEGIKYCPFCGKMIELVLSEKKKGRL